MSAATAVPAPAASAGAPNVRLTSPLDGGVRLSVLAPLVAITVVVFTIFTALGSDRDRWGFLVGAMLLVLLAGAQGASYVRFFYGLSSWRMAFRYLLAVVFGPLNFVGPAMGSNSFRLFYDLPARGPLYRLLMRLVFFPLRPFLQIEAGELRSVLGVEDLEMVQRIGGPARLLVFPGQAVVIESLDGQGRVIGEGYHQLSRFERIKEIVKLDEDQGELAEVPALTEDSIQVVVRNVRYRYRLYPGDRIADRSLGNPYLLNTEAVLRRVYNRSMTAGGYTPWNMMVGFAVDGAILNYINRHTLDQLTSPELTGGDPRAEIRSSLFSEDLRQRLRGVGAELLWVDIGHFELYHENQKEYREILKKQMRDSWKVHWEGNANEQRAHGEATLQAVHQQARAEAQAEVLMGVLRGLQDAGMAVDPDRNVRNILLLRTAQLLETMNDNHGPANKAV